MIDVVNLTVDNSISIDFLLITFELSEVYYDISNYKIDLQRSLSTTFTTIAEDIKGLSYVDKNVNLLNDTVYYYYRVRITDKRTGEKRYSDIARSGEGHPDRYALAILENEKKYIKDVIANPKAKVFKRIKFGEHCPNCYNPNRDSADDSMCPVCYGTGMKNGFYPPEDIYLNFYNQQQNGEEFSLAEVTDKGGDVSAWTLNYPKIDVNDLIVDGAKRWIVTTETDSTKGGWIIRQTLGLSEVPKSSVLFNVEVDHGLLET